MTIGTKLHQTLTDAESIAADLKSFALETNNKQAKQLYSRLADTVKSEVCEPLRSRVNEVEKEEPSYKQFS